MLLLDERNKDLIINYDVIFPEKRSHFVQSTLTELLSKPNEKIGPEIRKNTIRESKMDGEIDSPLIKTTESSTTTKYVISYDTPFTIAFLWNRSPLKWEIKDVELIAIQYMLNKSENIDTNNLSLLFKKIKDMGKLEEFYAYLETNPHPMENYFRTTYPDIAYFSVVFPIAKFTPKKITSIQEMETVLENFCGDYDREEFDRKIETATNNTEVIKRLRLHPNIRR